MRKTQFILPYLLLFLLLALGVSQPVYGQHTLGVQWKAPADHEQALAELDTLKKLGVELLEINSPLEADIWERLNALDFRVYAHLPVSFPLVQNFAQPDSMMAVESEALLEEYLAQSSVEALGLFRYGAVHHPDFATAFQPHLRQIRDNFSGALYYTTVRDEFFPIDQGVDFKMLEIEVDAGHTFSGEDSLASITGGIVYRPHQDIDRYLRPFRDFLNSYKDEPAPIFVSAEWLFPMMEKYPDFSRIIQLYHSDSEFVFPVPDEQFSTSASHSFIVLLIVAIWCVLAVNYHMSPVYRKSASRYFLGHAFFVEDVMKRHIRSVGASITIILLNILLAGISFYCVSQTSFSSLGLEAITYHYPVVSILQAAGFSVFIWGSLMATSLSLLSILLIKIGNKAIKSFRQVLNLYAWPLQLNFIFTTIMVTLLMAGSFPRITLVLALLCGVIHITAFILTAFDSAKYLGNKKGLFLAGGIALYLVMLTGIGYWLLTGNLPATVQLALHL